MHDNSARSWTKNLLDGYARDVPVYLELLNSTLIVCLAAYIIAGEETSEEDSPKQALNFRFWQKEISEGSPVRIDDLLYDVIFPESPKELRNAVNELARTTVPAVSPLVDKLFSEEPDLKMVRDITECLITAYYPSVIMESVSTPMPVNRMCLQLLAPGDGTFYDGTAGIGSTCIEAGRYAEKHGKQLFIYAREKLSILCPVLTIRAYINGVQDVEVQSGDILFPQKELQSRDSFFDYSVMFPPLGQSWDTATDGWCRYDLWGVPKSNSEWLFVQHQIRALRPYEGRGIIAVSTGTLFNEATRHIRERVLEENCIECVIGLPGNILPYTPTPLSLLVINRARPKSGDTDILMVQTEKLFSDSGKSRLAEQLNEKMIAAIVSAVEQRERTPWSRTVTRKEIRENDDILLPSRYIVENRVDSVFGPLTVDLREMQKWPSLESVSEKIYRGINSSQLSEDGAGRSFKLINYADVRDGVLDVGALKERAVAADASRYQVEPGDILISCKGAQIKTCIVPESAKGALLTLNFIGVRLKKQVYCPEFLLYFLNSPAGLSYLWGRQVGTSIITLKNKDLKQMPVPALPVQLQKRYVEEYDSVRRRLEDEIQELRMEQRCQEWDLYQKMGLGTVLFQEDQRDSAGQSGLIHRSDSI